MNQLARAIRPDRGPIVGASLFMSLRRLAR
jgi:hypothetical protein